MKTALGMAAIAALSLVGCKDKKAAPAAGSGSSAVSPAAKGTDVAKAPAGGKAKTCDELGGKKVGDSCELKKEPFEIVFAGKYDGNMMHPEPGAIFKVTNKSDRPVVIQSAQIYAYGKDGKQLEFTVNGSKLKYAQDSGSLGEIGIGETKEIRHSMGKENMPADMDTVQLVIPSWKGGDEQFGVEMPDMDNRPKDGWNK